MKEQNIHGILLDLDDTLYEYKPCNNAGIKKCISLIAKKYNLNKDKALKLFFKARKEAKKLSGKTGASHSRLLYFKRLTELVEGKTNSGFALELDRIFWKTYLEKMKLRKNSEKFLQTCKKQGIRIAIVTNLTTEIQLKKMKKLGLDKLVDFVVTSEETDSEKPDTRIIKTALQRIRCSKNKVLFIGDADDAKTSKKSKIRFLLIKNNSDWKKGVSIITGLK